MHFDFSHFPQGAALSTMTGFLTYGNKKFAHLDNDLRKLLPPLYSSMKELLPYVDHDAAAFNDYMVSSSLTTHVSLFCHHGSFVLVSFNSYEKGRILFKGKVVGPIY